MAKVHAVIVGVGAVGRQVATQLAAMGVPKLTLIDHDTVGPENLAPQGFYPADIDRDKVGAVRDQCRRQDDSIKVTTINKKFNKTIIDSLRGDFVVFSCVDAISVRRFIWESTREQARCFIDGRVASEVIRVLASNRPYDDRYYETTLFNDDEAYVGTCTSKMTIYCANIAAGMMISQMARWLRDVPVIPDQILNLLAGELTVEGENEQS